MWSRPFCRAVYDSLEFSDEESFSRFPRETVLCRGRLFTGGDLEKCDRLRDRESGFFGIPRGPMALWVCHSLEFESVPKEFVNG